MESFPESYKASGCHVCFLIRKWISCISLLFIFSTIWAQRDSMSMDAFNEQSAFSPAGIPIGTRQMPHMWMFSYSYMNSVLKVNMEGTSKVNDNYIFEKYIMVPKSMRMDMHMFMAMYGLTGKLSLMLMLNYQVMHMSMNMLPDSMHMMNPNQMGGSSAEMQYDTHGFSDAKTYAVYQLFSDYNHSVILDLGVSIPVGSIVKTDYNNIMIYGQRLPYMMQLGSGTFDFSPGIIYTYIKNNFFWSTSLTSVLHPFYNKAGYKLGNALILDTWAAYHWVHRLTSTLRFSASNTGYIKGNDTHIYESVEPASDPSNYGGKTVTGLVGLNYFFTDELLKNSKIALEFGLPLFQDLNGIQLATKHSIYLTWFINI